ncbi:MAG: hypothetical protein F4X64_06805 [Chloroflexi bacterium]|nr:hypothetical protein [Chloroflexota bacterium]
MRLRETTAAYRTDRDAEHTDQPIAAGASAAAQIRMLKNIPADWHHDESSNAPDPDGLEWLAGRFEQDYPANAPPAYIFPNPEGTVTALWKIDAEIQVEVEFNLDTRTAERWIHSVSNLTAQYDVVDLNTANSLKNIGARNVELAAASC